MADHRARRHNLLPLVRIHVLSSLYSLMGADDYWRVDDCLAYESAARNHPRSPDAPPLDQHPDRPMAAGALAPFRALSPFAPSAPQRRAADGSARRSRILLLDRRAMADAEPLGRI